MLTGMKVLLTGRPGSGKTTVAERLVERFREDGVAVGGFVTTEMREDGQRVGFRIRTAAGEEATLAHVDFPGPPTVGRYGVDLDALERVALPTLDEPADVLVIDELGPMELASTTFTDAVRRVFDSPTPVVATVHARGHPFTDELCDRDEVEAIEVTLANRNDLPKRIPIQLFG